jgi:hypothetical protein
MTTLVGMARWGLWVLLLALAWPAGGGLTLICKSPAPAMPCCAESMGECEIPAGMLPDCCLVVPESRSPAGVSAQLAAHQEVGSWDPWSLAPVTGVTALLGLGTDVAAPPPPSTLHALPPPYAAPFFSRTTALRI